MTKKGETYNALSTVTSEVTEDKSPDGNCFLHLNNRFRYPRQTTASKFE